MRPASAFFANMFITFVPRFFGGSNRSRLNVTWGSKSWTASTAQQVLNLRQLKALGSCFQWSPIIQTQLKGIPSLSKRKQSTVQNDSKKEPKRPWIVMSVFEMFTVAMIISGLICVLVPAVEQARLSDARNGSDGTILEPFYKTYPSVPKVSFTALCLTVIATMFCLFLYMRSKLPPKWKACFPWRNRSRKSKK